MPRTQNVPIRPLRDIGHPKYKAMQTDDGSWTLVDPVTHVAFHSGCGANAETDHVYVINGGIQEKLTRQSEFAVLEFGLGTGLGLVRTLDAFRRLAPTSDAISQNPRLRYVAIERDWLDVSVLSGLGHQPTDLFEDLIAQRRRWKPDARDPFRWEPMAGVSVEIWADEAIESLQEIQRGNSKFDAIYFDAFDPESNEDAWTSEILQTIVQMMKRDARLVTYCINRRVKELFVQCGLDPQAVAGPPGGKREVMMATLARPNA